MYCPWRILQVKSLSWTLLCVSIHDIVISWQKVAPLMYIKPVRIVLESLLIFLFFWFCSCDTKEKEISLERQSLCERQKTLQQEQDRLLDAQALLNQREDFIFGRSQELNRLEKELEDVKANIEKERRALDDGKLNLELTEASLINREEVRIALFFPHLDVDLVSWKLHYCGSVLSVCRL